MHARLLSGRPITGIGRFCLVLVTAWLAPGAHASAYRTVRDLPELSAYTHVEWSASEVVFSTPHDGVERSELLSVVGEFDNTLRTIGCLRLTVRAHVATVPFSLASRSGDGESSIVLVESPQWTGVLGLPAERMAVTELAYEPRGDGSLAIVEADILLNAQTYRFALEESASDPDARSLRGVLSHELAHAVGMAHVCETGGADGAPVCDASHADRMMYPEYVGASQSLPHPDDVAGLCALYPASTCAATCPSGSACVGGACVALCGSGTCAVGEVCEGQLCRASCGEQLCASGDVCVDGASCLAVCHGAVCPPGMLCGVSGACMPSCFGAPCDARVCDDTHPCPSSMTCMDGQCHTLEGSGLLRCDRDSECEDRTAICRYGACVTGSARLGDPCEGPASCASGLCADGWCASPCELGCTDGDTCEPTHGTAGACLPSSALGSLGERCASGAGCRSGLCLEVSASPRVCTRACALPEDDCPRSFVCRATDEGASVCVPRDLVHGCSLAPSNTSAPSWLVLLTPGFVALMLRKLHARSR